MAVCGPAGATITFHGLGWFNFDDGSQHDVFEGHGDHPVE
jgi:hypothetical protein